MARPLVRRSVYEGCRCVVALDGFFGGITDGGYRNNTMLRAKVMIMDRAI